MILSWNEWNISELWNEKMRMLYSKFKKPFPIRKKDSNRISNRKKDVKIEYLSKKL